MIFMSSKTPEPLWRLNESVLNTAPSSMHPAPTIRFRDQPYSGKLIVFEGVDGSGKSTSIQMAAEYLEESGVPAEILDLLSPNCRQLPYFRRYADDPTSAVRGETDQPSLGIVCLGDRLMRFRTHYYKKLAEGTWLLCDRYVFTPIAESLALGTGASDLEILVRIAEEFPRPDVGFMPIVDATTAIQRIRTRPKDQGKVLDPGFYTRAIASFRDALTVHDFVPLDTTSGTSTTREAISDALAPLVQAYHLAQTQMDR